MLKAPDWLPAVAAGDFSALPTPLLWTDTADFALLVDGYGLAGSHEKAGIVFRDVRGELRRTGTSTASACELWITLFFSWRRLRFVMGDQTDADVALLDRLCDHLRQRLQDLTPSERAEIDAAMEASPWKGRR